MKLCIEKVKVEADIVMKRLDQDPMNGDDLLIVFDEIIELTELNQQNNINLCRMGGIVALLELILAHPEDSVRMACGRIFSNVNSNNLRVQQISRKCGAINLAFQF